MSILRFILLFNICLIASKFYFISSCGMTTHTEISYRALHFFDNFSQKGVDYKKIINENLSYFQAGSPYPDWGYACNFSDASEHAHWPPYIHKYISYITTKYADNQKRLNEMIAFLFGIESHGISDVVWHWGRDANNADKQGFLHSMGHMTSDCKDNWNNCHDRGDVGGDMVLGFRGDSKWINKIWKIPIKDLQEIYNELSIKSDRTSMTQCAIMMYLGVRLEPVAAYYLLMKNERNAAFLSEELDLWYHGGIDDLAANVAWQWKNLIGLIEDAEGSKKYSDKFQRYKTKVRSFMKTEIINKVITNDNYHVFQQILGVENRHDDSNGDLILSFNRYNLKDAIIKIGDILLKNNVIDSLSHKQTYTDLGYYSFLSESLNSSAFFNQKLISDIPFSYFGKSVTFGDFDGDGVNEMAIGAPGYGKARGAVYILKSDNEINYSDPSLLGDSDFSRFGFSLTTVDLNHDGIDDLVVSAPIYGKNGPSNLIEDYYPKDYQGRVYVFYGKKGEGISKNSTPDLEIFPGNQQEIFFNLGYFLNSADCNNDGFKDLMIGSPYSQQNGDKRGHAALFLSSKNQDKLKVEDADLQAYGSNDYEELGYSLACQDNTLYIGAPGARYQLSADNQASGAVYAMDISSKSLKYAIKSDKPQARFGASLDVSTNILVVGAPSYDVVGSKYNFHNGVVFIYQLDKFTSEEISMNNYHTIIKSGDERARFGKKVKIVDDKLIVSAPQYTKNVSMVENGRVYVFNNFENLSKKDLNANNANIIYEGVSNSARLGENIAVNSQDTIRVILSAPFTSKTDMAGEIMIANLN